MMQVHKKILNKAIGRGGISCRCCNPKFSCRGTKKKNIRRKYGQITRTRLKRIVEEKEIE